MSPGESGSPAGPAATGVVVAVDVGTVRVGVAASDPDRILASPVATLRRDASQGRDLDELATVVRERRATLVIVGLPRTLAGEEGAAVRFARTYASALAERVAPVAVELVDERLTTVSAERSLAASGVRGRARRGVVDQAAAVVLLQAVLDRARG